MTTVVKDPFSPRYTSDGLVSGFRVEVDGHTYTVEVADPSSTRDRVRSGLVEDVHRGLKLVRVAG